MKQKSIIIAVFLLYAFSAEVLAESTAWQLVEKDMQARDQERRKSFKPVTNDEFVYELRKPLTGTNLKVQRGKVCYQPGIRIEVQDEEIVYITKDPLLTKKIPCPQ